jgi:anthranilate synthase component 1
VPTLFDIPADLDTPVGAFLKLGPLRPRFLLESVGGAGQQARHSFIGLDEGLGVRLEDGRLTIDGRSAPAPRTPAGLLEALRTALQQAPRPLGPDGEQAEGLPFRGGLCGACGFDLARRLGRLPNQAPRDRGLEAVFTAPRSVLVFDHETRRAALLHAGSAAERAGLRREVLRLLRAPAPVAAGGAALEPPREVLGRARYADGVLQAKRAIRDGEVFQLVLAEGFEGRTDLDPVRVYRALRLTNPSPYMFCVRLDEERTVVGSSPEVLCAMDGREARLRPIAGTRPRGRDRDRDAELERELLADPKEAAEHVMLVDLARNDLGRVAEPGSVAVAPSRVVERYSHVMHLVSGVVGRVEPQFDQFDLFASAFPAGTVSGAPKTRALELIEELEPEPRGFYAGTVGYFGHGGQMDQALAIRTLWFEGDRYSFRAGAGIVADSVPEREHDEVLAKGRALGEALRVAKEEL